MIPDDLPLPRAWASNLRAIIGAPLACVPTRILPCPQCATIAEMHAAGLVSIWDRRDMGLGWYATLHPWPVECLGLELQEIPPRRLAEAERAARAIGIEPSPDDPLERWGPAPGGRPPWGLAALARAQAERRPEEPRILRLGDAEAPVPVAVIVPWRRPRRRA